MIGITNCIKLSLILILSIRANIAHSNDFTTLFYDVIKNSPGNLFFSPLSIETILELTYLGSQGSTSNQLQTSLKFVDKSGLLKHVKSVNTIKQKNDGITLSMANGVFTSQDFPIRPEFIETAQEIFNAQVQALPFSSGEKVLSYINSWVDQKTQHKIPTLLSPGSIDGNTGLILANAVYFKGKWLKPFKTKHTEKGKFYLNDVDTVEVDFMKQLGEFYVKRDETLNSFIVSLPYVGEKINMILIVPQEKMGLKSVEDKLKYLDLNELTSNFSMKNDIILTMPKLQMEKTIDLQGPLKELGIKDLFLSTECNLSGISENQKLYVSKALQKSFIEINEEGSEAAASTGEKAEWRIMPPPPIELNINSPFLFFIRHERGQFIFIGRVENPIK